MRHEKSLFEGNLWGGAIGLLPRKLCFILSEIYNPDIYSYIFTLASKLRKEGYEVGFVELENLTGKSFHRIYANKTKENAIFRDTRAYKEILLERLLYEGFEIKHVNVTLQSETVEVDVHYIRDLFEIRAFSSLVQDMVFSLTTFNLVKTSNPDYRLSRFERQQVSHWFNSYEIVKASLNEFKNFILPPYEGIVCVNGRLPDVAAVIEVASERAKDIFYLESGALIGRSFSLLMGPSFNLTSYKTTYVNKFAHVSSNTTLTLPKEPSFIEEWMHSKRHLYDENLTEPLAILPILEERRIATVFTSSMSEAATILEGRISLEIDFYRSAVELLLAQGYEVTIRIHPNQSNYHYSDLNYLLSALWKYRKRIKLVLPWDRVSSYSLISKSSVVVTSQSTIGIEAALVGKKVFVAPYCYYAGDAQVSILSEESLKDFSCEQNKNWKTIRTVHIYTRYGYTVDDDDFRKEYGSFESELNQMYMMRQRTRNLNDKSVLTRIRLVSRVPNGLIRYLDNRLGISASRKIFTKLFLLQFLLRQLIDLS